MSQRSLLRFVGFGCVFATTTAMCSSTAIAQSFSDADYRYAYIGPGSVEVQTGRFAYDAADLSVGTGEFPIRMEFRRQLRSTIGFADVDSIGGFRHNFNVTIGCANGSGTNFPGACPGVNERAVRVGNMAYTFKIESGAWVSKYADGAKLIEESNRWVFQGNQGERIIFPKNSSFYNFEGTTHLASLWEFPNGDFLTFQYEIAVNAFEGWNARRRLTQVVNSRGYGLKFNYLLAGGGQHTIPYDNAFYRKHTISSVEAISPGCVSTSTVNCAPGSLGSVTYAYSNISGTPYVKLDSVTRPVGSGTAVSSFQWSGGGLISETNPAIPGSFLFQNLFSGGKIQQQTDPLNQVWLYRRTTPAVNDPNSTIVAEIENPDAKITKYQFTANRYSPDWIEDPYGKRANYTYDSFGRVKTMTMPLGRKVEYIYDGRGNITSVTTTPSPGISSDQSQREVGYIFPACDSTNWKICNKPSKVTDERLGATDFTYNPSHGGIETVLGPADTPSARSLTKYTYATFARAPTVETSDPSAPLPDIYQMTEVENCLSSNGTATYVCPTADSIKTSLAYDASTAAQRTQALPKSTTIDPNGIAATTSLKFDLVGNVVSVDGPRSDSDIAQMEFNKDRRIKREVAPDPDGTGPLAPPETNYEYDDSGNVKFVRAKLGGSELTTSFQYNAANQIIQVSDPATGTKNQTYDIVGRPKDASQTVEGSTRTMRNVYDNAGRIKEVRSAVGVPGLEQATVTNTYNDDGELIAIADAKGNTTNYCRDGYGSVAEMRFPSTANPGTSLSCSAAPAGTLAASADYVGYHYDAAGNATSVRLRDGQAISYEYDAQNRVKLKDVPGTANDVTYVYDLAGRQKAANLTGTNAALSVSWDYDKLSRTVSTTSAGRTLSYGYNASGDTETLTWPDGKVATYKSDALDRTTEVYGIAQATTGPLAATFGYDQLSRRTGIALGNNTSVGYGYDAQYRLQQQTFDLAGSISDLTTSFTYNEAGQVKTRDKSNNAYAWTNTYNVNRPYTTNGLNQYSTSGDRNLTYDGRGNLIGDGNWTFNYDAENRMVSTTGPNAVTLSYDAIGRLAKTSTNDVETSFLYDGDLLVGEYDDTGTLVRRVLQGPGQDEPIIVYENTGDEWLYGDYEGSIEAIADGSGNIVSVMSYGPFGEPSYFMDGRFAYTGQEFIPELGLYYYRARFYSPLLGRFMQTDPTGYDDGMNLYDYVGGDPINNTDPDGLDADPLYPGGILVVGRRPSSWPSPSASGGFANSSFYLGGMTRGGSAPPSYGNMIPRLARAQAQRQIEQARRGLCKLGTQVKNGGDKTAQGGFVVAAGGAVFGGVAGGVGAAGFTDGLGAPVGVIAGAITGAGPGVRIADFGSKVSATGQAMRDASRIRTVGGVFTTTLRYGANAGVGSFISNGLKTGVQIGRWLDRRQLIRRSIAVDGALSGAGAVLDRYLNPPC